MAQILTHLHKEAVCNPDIADSFCIAGITEETPVTKSPEIFFEDGPIA
jgi:hypothetical protein